MQRRQGDKYRINCDTLFANTLSISHDSLNLVITHQWRIIIIMSIWWLTNPLWDLLILNQNCTQIVCRQRQLYNAVVNIAIRSVLLVHYLFAGYLAGWKNASVHPPRQWRIPLISSPVTLFLSPFHHPMLPFHLPLSLPTPLFTGSGAWSPEIFLQFKIVVAGFRGFWQQ